MLVIGLILLAIFLLYASYWSYSTRYWSYSTRPISVTPILSRMVERLAVKNHISPAIPPTKLNDQFGFKPMGSTTSALVDLTNTISVMLETNKYVRCLLIDFSKAYYSVDHLIIINKLKEFNIADNIFRWMASF